MLTPDRERTALNVFSEAVELGAAARLEWITQACGGDPELLDRVIRLNRSRQRSHLRVKIHPKKWSDAGENPGACLSARLKD